MAGSRETPGDRRARDEALAAAAAAAEAEAAVDRPAPAPRTKATAGRATIASAAVVPLNDRKAIAKLRAQRQAWQTDAWDYVRELPEVGATLRFAANMMSKIRLWAAVRPDPEGEPVPVGDDASGLSGPEAELAKVTLERLGAGAEGGWPSLLRALDWNLCEVAGEVYLHGHEDPETGVETWAVRSVDELVAVGDHFELRTALGAKGEKIPDTDAVKRLWSPDPRFCADHETEMLTLDGWRRYDEVRAGDAALTLNHETGLSEWQPVLAVNRYDVSDELMTSIEGMSHSSLTTSSHRWPVRRDGEAAWTTSGRLNRVDRLVTAAPCADLPTEAKWSDDLVELVAWFWTEGSIATRTPRPQVTITQSHRVNPDKVDRIRRALTGCFGPPANNMRGGAPRERRAACSFPDCGWPVSHQGLCNTHGEQRRTGRPLVPVKRRRPHPGWGFSSPEHGPMWREHREPNRGTTQFWLNAAASEVLVAIAPRKVVHSGFIHELTAAQLELFIATSVDADGTRDGPTEMIAQNNAERLVPFELACVLAGRTPTTRARMARYRDQPYPMWSVTASRKTAYAIDQHPYRRGPWGKSSTPSVEQYDGVVWCPTTANGTWLARRRGTVYFTGNSSLASSPMREVLSTCEVLLLLGRAMRSDAMSHLNSGILVKAHEMSFGPGAPGAAPGDADPPEDTFEENLNQLLVDPIEDPGSAAAVAPGVISAPGEFAEKDKYLWHLTFSRPIDDKLVQWIETLVLRLARGLNMPVEVTRGLADTKFANAAVSKKSEWDAYGEPRAVLMVDALTVSYYREALVEGGMSPETAATVFVWYDPAGALSAPDPVDFADKDHEDGIISDDARRKAHGWNEADAPTDLDLLRRMIYQGKLRDPGLIVQILRLLGIADLEAPPASPARQAAIAAAANPSGLALGRRLAAIDRDLRLRVHVAAEQAMRRLLDRAGARVRPKLGRDGPAAEAASSVPNRRLCAALGRDVVVAAAGDLGDVVDGAFDELADDFGAWVEVAQRAAAAEVERAVGPLSAGDAEQLRMAQAQGLAAARERLRETLADLAGRRLYDPAPGAAAVGESEASSTVPVGLVREALALAGGDKPQGGDGEPLVGPDGGPVGGVATGPDVMSVAGGVEGYVWDYGTAPRTPFPPHEALDGVEFQYPDDDVLANDEGWPDAPFYMPGDHEGCVCTWIPVILTPDEGGD